MCSRVQLRFRFPISRDLPTHLPCDSSCKQHDLCRVRNWKYCTLKHCGLCGMPRCKKLILRSPCDWKGIHCAHVTVESLRNCPCPPDNRDDHDHHNDHGNDHGESRSSVRSSARQREQGAQWRQMRDAELTKIQDHYYRVKAKLLSCDKEEFFERADALRSSCSDSSGRL